MKINYCLIVNPEIESFTIHRTLALNLQTVFLSVSQSSEFFIKTSALSTSWLDQKFCQFQMLTAHHRIEIQAKWQHILKDEVRKSNFHYSFDFGFLTTFQRRHFVSLSFSALTTQQNRWSHLFQIPFTAHRTEVETKWKWPLRAKRLQIWIEQVNIAKIFNIYIYISTNHEVGLFGTPMGLKSTLGIH